MKWLLKRLFAKQLREVLKETWGTAFERGVHAGYKLHGAELRTSDSNPVGIVTGKPLSSRIQEDIERILERTGF